MAAATLPQVRVKTKHQITLPAAIARVAGIGVNDILSVDYRDGVVSLITQNAPANKRRSLMDLAGSTPGLYGNTAEEIQAYTANERKSWER
jgi:bifunctional DNA-binding transcriptional regulator/antitoxin component of YhaV-PrlF toxin-antitoxin module